MVVLPAEGEGDYVNLHPTTFHWWEVGSLGEPALARSPTGDPPAP